MEKIKYKEIEYKDFVNYKKNSKLNLNVFTNFLFNGSRRGIIDEKPDELSIFLKDNGDFMNYLKNNINVIFDNIGLSVDERYEKMPYLWRVNSFGTSKKFEYGDFYLTNNFLTAISFSNNGAGELCELSYKCACVIKNMGIVFEDDKINIIMKRILEKYEKYSRTERVVLVVCDVDFDDLKTESGTKFSYDFQKERLYSNSVTLSNAGDKMNVRLGNLSKYEFLLIKESNFKKYIPIFTDIKENEITHLQDLYYYKSQFDFLF